MRKYFFHMVGVFLVASFMGCGSSNKEFDDVLNAFDEMVVVYESYTKKDPFCIEYLAQINGEVLAKLNDVASKAKKIKESGPEPSKEQIDRYIKISKRMSNTMMALSSRMREAKMCGNAFGAAAQNSVVRVPQESTPSEGGALAPDIPAPNPATAIASVSPEVVTPSAANAEPVAASTETTKPSFDCSKASNTVEKMVCASPELAKLDVQMAEQYKNARTSASDQNQLKSEQMSWIKKSRACKDEACLAQAYRLRIDELSK